MRTLLCLLGIIFHPSGTFFFDAQTPLDLDLNTSRQEITLGETMTLNLLFHAEQAEVEVLEISNAAPDNWAWETSPGFSGVVENDHTVSWQASPQHSGTLNAMVRVRYKVDEEIFEKLVTSSEIHVLPLEGSILARAVIQNSSGGISNTVRLQVEIANQTPFVIDHLRLSLPGKRDILEIDLPDQEIGPGQTAHLYTEVRRSDFLPTQSALFLFQAQTEIGMRHLSVRLDMEENSLSAPDWFTANPFLSVVFGALTSLAGILFGFWLEQRRKNRIYAEQVQSLLEMFCRRVISAGQHGRELNTKPLETIYQSEGLFRTLVKHKVVQETGRLWELVDQHNDYLHKRQGLSSPKELEMAVGSLRRKLKKTEGKLKFE